MTAQIPNTLFEWALTVIGGSTLIVFAVALQNFFVQPATLTRAQRLFQDVSVLIGITHGFGLLVLNAATNLQAGIGIAMYSGALTLFLSAIEAARRTPLTRTFVYEPRCDVILRPARTASSATPSTCRIRWPGSRRRSPCKVSCLA